MKSCGVLDLGGEISPDPVSVLFVSSTTMGRLRVFRQL